MNPDARRAEAEARVRLCLDGLSLGDAFGEMFFGSPRSARAAVAGQSLPPGKWWYTDDTEMALAIAEVLKAKGEINQDALALRFAIRFLEDPDRSYGKGTRAFCEWLNRGVAWRQANALTFKGGSMGNGSAMRVAPVGAWFADAEFPEIVRQARLSAEVTHRHAEGLAGAIAVALAAAVAWRERHCPVDRVADILFEILGEYVPPGETLRGIQVARQLPRTADPEEAAKALGNGTLVTCPDTVPYVIWSACKNLGDFQEAILQTLAGGGDTDTTCAMVGGIVALYVGPDNLPAEWLNARETLKWS